MYARGSDPAQSGSGLAGQRTIAIPENNMWKLRPRDGFEEALILWVTIACASSSSSSSSSQKRKRRKATKTSVFSLAERFFCLNHKEH